MERHTPVLADLSLPETFYPLGPLASAVAWSRSVAKSLGRLLLRRRRNFLVVNAEYHAGHWARVLRERSWERTRDPIAFLVGESTEPIVVKLGETYFRTTPRDYYRYRIEALRAFLAPHVGSSGSREIVELGCGFGYNLLSLVATDPELRVLGFDISENGIAAARQIFDHFGFGDRAQFDLIDLTRADDPSFAHVCGRTVFTFFCLEQIPYAIDAVVRNILAHRPQRVVHVEPGLSMLSWARLKDWPNWFYVRSMEYQTRLFDSVAELEQQGVLRVLERRRLPFSPTIQNNGFSIVWEPR
jgi:SAM-dependent methyltransferase